MGYRDKTKLRLRQRTEEIQRGRSSLSQEEEEPQKHQTRHEVALKTKGLEIEKNCRVDSIFSLFFDLFGNPAGTFHMCRMSCGSMMLLR